MLLRCCCDAAVAPRCIAVICCQIIDITRCGRRSRGCLGLLEAFLKPSQKYRRKQEERDVPAGVMAAEDAASGLQAKSMSVLLWSVVQDIDLLARSVRMRSC